LVNQSTSQQFPRSLLDFDDFILAGVEQVADFD
jgi:hypothetical protein